MGHSAKLSAIVELFAGLNDAEKRETLISYSDQAHSHEPRKGEVFDCEDVRKDEECADTVAVFLSVTHGRCHFRMILGPKVQTLTKAMCSILCKGLEGLDPSEILEIPSDFVPKIVGAELVRVRSQTVYYLLTRMKGIVKVWLNHKRSAEAPDIQFS